MAEQAKLDSRTHGARRSWFPRWGLWAWSFVGFVAATVIVAIALGAVSEIALPLTFAAVLAVIFTPAARLLERHRVTATFAAGLVVLGLLALMAGVAVATVRGVIDQADQIRAAFDAALNTLGMSATVVEDARAAVEQTAPVISGGVLSELVSGLDALIGLASGLILGALIMYYLLKDGTRLRQSLVAQFDAAVRSDLDRFLGDASQILRDYGRARTVMSAIVSLVIGATSLLLGLPLVFTIVVVNFVGGYIPYIGAFLGGGLAVIVALGDGGLSQGVVMLMVVLVANLVLENFVEPKVMGHSLDIHPLVVLIVTALGGIVGGIVGLMLAVPFFVIARDAIARLRSSSFPMGLEVRRGRVR